MTGILAQTISLTSYGNEYLLNGKLNNFFPNHSSFEHCKNVEFIATMDKNFVNTKKEITGIKNPELWFEPLASASVPLVTARVRRKKE